MLLALHGLHQLHLAGDHACAELAEVRRVQAETKRIYSIMYSERFENRATVKAGELVKAGAIGSVMQTIGLGPHRLNAATRPAWFFDKERYGGIICERDLNRPIRIEGSDAKDDLSIYSSSAVPDSIPVTINGNGGDDRIHGGTFTPSDESGDARVFTQRLAALCRERGILYVVDNTILSPLAFRPATVGAGDAGVDVASVEFSRSKDDSYIRQFYGLFTDGHLQIGPGVFDVHSPHTPGASVMSERLHHFREFMDTTDLWVNPDCGLKTRGWEEIEPRFDARNPGYEVWPQKVAPETWDLLEQYGLTIGALPNLDYPMSQAAGLSLMVFYVFAMQCMSTLAIVKRETKSWKWPMIQLFYMTGLAYLSAFAVFQIFS